MRKLMRTLGACALGMLLALASVGSAKATLAFQLNYSLCCGDGPFGHATMTQASGEPVHVIAQLYAPYKFAGAGLHALAFNVDGPPVGISNLTAGFGNFQVGGTAGPFEGFGYTIDCLVCTEGGNNPTHLEFDITRTGGLTLDDIWPNNLGFFLAAGITSLGGPTGYVPSGGYFGGVIPEPEVASVPEPTTLALLGAGLVGLGLVKRRRGQSTRPAA